MLPNKMGMREFGAVVRREREAKSLSQADLSGAGAGPGATPAAPPAAQREALEREYRDLERRQRLLAVLIGKSGSEAEAERLVGENKRLAGRRRAEAREAAAALGRHSG